MLHYADATIKGIYLADQHDGGATASSAMSGDYPFGLPLLMLYVGAGFYAALAVYLDCIVPGNGPRRPWYFPFQWASKCCCRAVGSHANNRYTDDVIDDGDNDLLLGGGRGLLAHETINGESTDLQDYEHESKEAVIKIRGLTKEFGSKGSERKRALGGVHLDIYDGQIFGLLGHNGAGKSTTFNILAGILQPTAGKVEIYGKDLTDPDELDEIRSQLGVCAQQDTLQPALTSFETLDVFFALKGFSNQADRAAQADALLADLDLSSSRDKLTKHLSGGQKRRLCLCMSLIGDPKVSWRQFPPRTFGGASSVVMWRCGAVALC